jgi:beta-fructofuranosidase
MMPWLHYMPSAGWMNDPNGLVNARGLHHMYYQLNPAGTEFANQHWGHASSADLLRWTEHEVALGPGPGGYDATACFSGCAVPDPGGPTWFLYTGVAGRVTLPCLAYDDEGGVLRKDPGNPVIPAWPGPDVTDFRDHAVWRDGGRWWQLVAGARTGRGGTLFAYASDDPRSWEYRGVYADRDTTGVPGAVWECPDRLCLPGGDAIVVSVIHAQAAAGLADVWWMTGVPDGARFAVTGIGVCDLGDRFYAPQSYDLPDGRRVQIGWVRTHPSGLGGRPFGRRDVVAAGAVRTRRPPVCRTRRRTRRPASRGHPGAARRADARHRVGRVDRR